MAKRRTHPPSGTSESAILEFESLNSVRVPDDMRYYLLTVNGMTPDWPDDQDQNGFTFWPLSRVREVVRGESRAGLFIFADYLSSSWEYAIKLVGPHEYAAVFLVDPEIGPIASSFSEFLREYLVDSPKIYRRVAGSNIAGEVSRLPQSPPQIGFIYDKAPIHLDRAQAGWVAQVSKDKKENGVPHFSRALREVGVTGVTPAEG